MTLEARLFDGPPVTHFVRLIDEDGCEVTIRILGAGDEFIAAKRAITYRAVHPGQVIEVWKVEGPPVYISTELRRVAQ